MPNEPSTNVVPKHLPRNEWVVMEELVTVFVVVWSDQDRHIDIPDGVRVHLKHEMSTPPYFWEITLGPGLHRFQLNEGWNKFVAMSLDSNTTVGWRL